ncbi:hypothetical protein E1301_Tti016606 [Triplophysa tibetana]|uniref:Uncharacterized protein n=1 Tax=Triplophysa tibetana TaxID=1572043 RepID=A0A5A9NXP9_9TELE|nr:hypothetical protein E1301_Tti016606 [Triplophysa tibetana]
MPGTKGNKTDKKSTTTKQPQSPKEQPKKGDQKGDDTKKQGVPVNISVYPSQESRRERSNSFHAFVKLALETLLGSCRRKHGNPMGLKTTAVFAHWKLSQNHETRLIC